MNDNSPAADAAEAVVPPPAGLRDKTRRDRLAGRLLLLAMALLLLLYLAPLVTR